MDEMHTLNFVEIEKEAFRKAAKIDNAKWTIGEGTTIGVIECKKEIYETILQNGSLHVKWFSFRVKPANEVPYYIR